MFKEGPPASRRRFEEASPTVVAKVSRSFQEVPPSGSHINGEMSRTEEQGASTGGKVAGKWQSLVSASDVLEKGTPAPSAQKEKSSQKEKVTVSVTEESKPEFARPTLTPSEMDAVLMPPPKLPGGLNSNEGKPL